MKKLIAFFIFFVCTSRILFSQILPEKTHGTGLLFNNMEISKVSILKSPLNKGDFDFNSIAVAFICIINPELIYENKKINFGLTKEVSLAFPLYNTKDFGTIGRIGFEYSYIFRDERNHHLRSFLNVDIPYSVSDFIAFTYGIGAGYFTDFKKNGIFPQASINMIIPVSEYLAVNPYTKLRHTFMLDRTQSDNTDISVGVGFMFLSLF